MKQQKFIWRLLLIYCNYKKEYQMGWINPPHYLLTIKEDYEMKVYCLFREVTDIYSHDNYKESLFNKKLVSIHATKEEAIKAAIKNGLMLIGTRYDKGIPATIEEMDIEDLTIIRFVTALVLEKENEYIFDFGATPILDGKQIIVKKQPNVTLTHIIAELQPEVRDMYYNHWYNFSTRFYVNRPHYMLTSVPITPDIIGVNVVHFPVIGNELG